MASRVLTAAVVLQLASVAMSAGARVIAEPEAAGLPPTAAPESDRNAAERATSPVPTPPPDNIGGDTWSLWGTRADTNPTRNCHQPSLHVAEGDQNRLYLAYQYENDAADRAINVVYSNLNLQTAVFTIQTALSQTGVDFQFPDLSSDEMNFNAYRLDTHAYAILRTSSGGGL